MGLAEPVPECRKADSSDLRGREEHEKSGSNKVGSTLNPKPSTPELVKFFTGAESETTPKPRQDHRGFSALSACRSAQSML